MAEKKEQKAEVAYFRCYEFAGLSVSAGDGTFERFDAYFDKFKGDTIKVGYLKTENPKVAELCRADANVEELDDKEYKLAIEGDGKRNQPLKRAPVAAV